MWEILRDSYARPGLGRAAASNRAFEQMVLARLIEPTSRPRSLACWVTWAWSRPAYGPCSVLGVAAWSRAIARASHGHC